MLFKTLFYRFKGRRPPNDSSRDEDTNGTISSYSQKTKESFILLTNQIQPLVACLHDNLQDSSQGCQNTSKNEVFEEAEEVDYLVDRRCTDSFFSADYSCHAAHSSSALSLIPLPHQTDTPPSRHLRRHTLLAFQLAKYNHQGCQDGRLVCFSPIITVIPFSQHLPIV
jgi:hypothetical protein